MVVMGECPGDLFFDPVDPACPAENGEEPTLSQTLDFPGVRGWTIEG